MLALFEQNRAARFYVFAQKLDVLDVIVGEVRRPDLSQKMHALTWEILGGWCTDCSDVAHTQAPLRSSKGKGANLPQLGRVYCTVTQENSATQGEAWEALCFLKRFALESDYLEVGSR